jgi:hypothetical protein
MREMPRRAILVIIALAMITIFVIGAVELASEDENSPAADPPAPAETAQTEEQQPSSTSESIAANESQPTATTPTTPTATSPPAATAPSGSSLPSTGPGDIFMISAAIPALLLLGKAYVSSRQHVRQMQLDRP